MHGSFKVQKTVTDAVPYFQPILPAIGTPAYTCKASVLLLGPLTANEYTIRYSITFADKLQSCDPKLAMGSFDVESL